MAGLDPDRRGMVEPVHRRGLHSKGYEFDTNLSDHDGDTDEFRPDDCMFDTEEET